MSLRKHYPYPINEVLFQKARDEVFEKVSIPQYIYDNVDGNVDLRTERKMCCPLHEENTPSFVYNEDKNIWTCYGKCSRSGKVIDLHMLLHGINHYHSGLMHLRQMYGAKYNLTFVDFFMYEGNREMKVEDVIGLKRTTFDANKFLGKKEKSASFLIDQINQQLGQLKMYSLDLFIRNAIRYDALFNYQQANVVELEKFHNHMKQEIQNARK